MSTGSHQSSAGVSLSAAGASSWRPQPTQAERTADARKAFLSSLGVAAKDVDVELQSRAKNIHGNAQSLTKQEKQVQEQTKDLAKQNAEMEKWLEKSNKKLAEFNDLLNFDAEDEGFEDDLDDLEAMLDLMEGEGVTTKSKSDEADVTPNKR